MAELATTHFTTHSPEETVEVGRRIASQLSAPILCLLLGDLGAGKTTLTKGIVEGLGAASTEEVTSPTFTLVHEYGSGRSRAARVYHIDLYRVEDAADLMTLGLEDMLAENAIVLVEWGERLSTAFRNPAAGSKTLEIRITASGEYERQLQVREL
jgi:tRNA threonylcarbamoyladenosine biosynthesis protein TsaE